MKPYRLCLENLENRVLLAGDVSATLRGGSINISGDGQDNAVVVTQIQNDYAVVGINTRITNSDFSESINGIDVDIKLFDQGQVKKDIVARLRGGDDGERMPDG